MEKSVKVQQPAVGTRHGHFQSIEKDLFVVSLPKGLLSFHTLGQDMLSGNVDYTKGTDHTFNVMLEYVAPTDTRRSGVTQLVAARRGHHEPGEVAKFKVIWVLESYLHGVVTQPKSGTKLLVRLFTLLSESCFALFEPRALLLMGVCLLLGFNSINESIVISHCVVEAV